MVLATFQVTVWVLSPAHEIPVALGIFIMRGPEFSSTVKVKSNRSFAPPPVALSLTTNRKLSVRATVGKTSHSGVVLVTKSLSLGKYRVPLIVGEKPLKLGPPVAVPTGG